MEKLLNNFYVEWSLFIIFIAFAAIASIDILKNKHNIDIKNKLNYKNIDFKFLLKMIFLSLGLRIILEHYLIPTNVQFRQICRSPHRLLLFCFFFPRLISFGYLG